MEDDKLTVYDIAKQTIGVQNPLDPLEFNAEVNRIADYILSHKYTMLLCKERSDYTVFRSMPPIYISDIIADLNECIHSRGHLIFVDQEEENGPLELWIRDYDTNENFAYFLFDYTFGVIEYGGENNE